MLSLDGPLNAILINFYALFNFIDKYFGWLKGRHIMLINYNSCILRDVSGNFFCSFLIYKTSKPPHIYIVSVRKRVFNYAEECLHRNCYVGFVDTSLLSNLADYVCFSH